MRLSPKLFWNGSLLLRKTSNDEGSYMGWHAILINKRVRTTFQLNIFNSSAIVNFIFLLDRTWIYKNKGFGFMNFGQTLQMIWILEVWIRLNKIWKMNKGILIQIRAMGRKWRDGLTRNRNRPSRGPTTVAKRPSLQHPNSCWAGPRGRGHAQHRARSGAACANSAWRMARSMMSKQWPKP
jgi:hypothetical protein